MIQKTVLANGTRVISEEISHVRSVSIGAWVSCGSCHEDAATNGTAHFIEHMLFKGTEGRSAFDIAWAIDSVGGVMNAFTGKELTAFYLKVPDYHLPLAIDILGDIFAHSRFAAAEIEKEKSVILQEIHMLEDSPSEYIHDYIEALFWDDHPLGLPILGTKERVSGMTRDTLVGFFRSRYQRDNLVLTAAGNLKHEDLVDLLSEVFGFPRGDIPDTPVCPPLFSPRASVLEKDLEQVHMVVAAPAPSAVSDKRHASLLLNAVLGGSMSSRLFQEIREKRGLAYDVQSYLVPYRHTGMLGVYVGTDRGRIADIVQLIRDAFDGLASDLLDERELQAVKEQLKGNFLLSMESTDTRMTRLARNEIFFRRNVSEEEVVSAIEAVTGAEIRDLASELFRPEGLSAAAIGRIGREDLAPILCQ